MSTWCGEVNVSGDVHPSSRVDPTTAWTLTLELSWKEGGGTVGVSGGEGPVDKCG